MASLRESEEQQAVPTRAGDFTSYGAERAVVSRLILKASFEHPNNDVLAVVAAG
jgi:hypothetical protein